MNVINVNHIERELSRVAATARHQAAREWICTVARNAIINGTMTDKDLVQNFIVYDSKKPPFGAPEASVLPDWAKAALSNGETLHWFDSLQVQRREFWKMIEGIIHWFNSWKLTDPRFNRLTRINFGTAVNAAAMWNKDISANLWNYVQDKPPVIYRSTNGFVWVRLITELHFEREDRLMNHCLHKQGIYFKRHADNEFAYYSLRDRTNRPHVTMEVKIIGSGKVPTGSEVHQCKGNSNRKPQCLYQPHITAFVRDMHFAIVGDHSHMDCAPSTKGSPWS